jgi:hypothetical protein
MNDIFLVATQGGACRETLQESSKCKPLGDCQDTITPVKSERKLKNNVGGHIGYTLFTSSVDQATQIVKVDES